MTRRDGLAIWLPVGLWLAVTASMLAQTLPDAATAPWSITEDDGRHFVAWLRAMADPALFTDDPIAEYFGALTPTLFKWLFLPAVWLGIDVMTWDMLVLAPAIAALTILAADRLLRHVFDDPLTRAVCIALVLYMIMDKVTAGLPKSFASPILCAALAFYLERRLVAMALVLAAGANLYPVAAMVATSGIGMAGLFAWAAERRFSAAEPRLVIAALLATLAGLAVFMASADGTGASFTLDEARSMRIFGPGGRTAFFRSDLGDTLFCSQRGGYFETCFGLSPAAAVAAHAIALGAAGVVLARHRSGRLFRLLAGLLAGGTILYLIAYAVAFRAHLPNRYAPLAFTILVPIALTVPLLRAADADRPALRRLARATSWLLLAAFLFHALVTWTGNYFRDSRPAVSAALRALPKDSMVASFAWVADSVPAFAGRSIFVSEELAVPYKRPYYALVVERLETQARLYAGPADAAWQARLAESGIDVFLHGPGTRPGWQRLQASFEALPDWPGSTVFDRQPAAVAACRIADVDEIDVIDAACFAAQMATGSDG